jgi:phosphatidylglycerol:prolipoprotein diacylglycerol transferase
VIFDSLQYPNLDPSALTIPGFDLFNIAIGPLHLRWYALAYIAGLVLGWRWMVWLIRRDRLWTPGQPALSVPQTDDFLFWATLGVILGGRIGYVLFYNTSMIWERPLAMFEIWQGGMSFHGGFIGVALAAYFFTRGAHVNEPQFVTLAKKRAVAEPPRDHRNDYTKVAEVGWMKKTDVTELREKARTDKIDLLRLSDLAAAATPIGLFFGRIANFINGELWGRVTHVPWGMVFCNETILTANHGTCPAGTDPRHPSQIYEAALEGVLLFTIINVATLKFDSLRRPGMNAGLFLFFYGLFRASTEFVREPDFQMPEFFRHYITMGMLLSTPMMILGLWLIRRALKRPKLAAA